MIGVLILAVAAAMMAAVAAWLMAFGAWTIIAVYVLTGSIALVGFGTVRSLCSRSEAAVQVSRGKLSTQCSAAQHPPSAT